MITKEKFIDLIKNNQNYHKQLDRISDAFNRAFDVYSASVFEYADLLFDQLMSVHFNEDGCDWIFWWMFEKPYNQPNAFDENNNIIPTETVEDLWNIVKEYMI